MHLRGHELTSIILGIARDGDWLTADSIMDHMDHMDHTASINLLWRP